MVEWGGNGGGGEKPSDSCSSCRILVRDNTLSHAGGRIFARRWCLRSRASHNGSRLRYGGWRAGIGPYGETCMSACTLAESHKSLQLNVHLTGGVYPALKYFQCGVGRDSPRVDRAPPGAGGG